MHFLSLMALFFFVFGQWGELWNKKSILTTERRLELPGMILEPGEYVVRLQESGERRSLVQILNRNEDQVYATLVAVPDHRVRPDGNLEFRFHQVSGDGPQPLQSWYYATDLVGLEFVYPKNRAKQLAKATDGHVMASNNKDAVIVAVTPNGKEVLIDEPVQTARQKPQ